MFRFSIRQGDSVWGQVAKGQMSAGGQMTWTRYKQGNCPGLSKMYGFVSKNPGEVSQQKVHDMYFLLRHLL